jgi:hypothetical protein
MANLRATSETVKQRLTAATCVLLITAKNCEPVTGIEWRVFRRDMTARGVPIYQIGKKLVIRADDALAALDGSERSVAPTPTEDLTDDQQRAAMLAELGLRGRG